MDEASGWQRSLGLVGLAGVGAWVSIVVLLHGIKSELDPVDTYISDYAIGDNGWLMQLAFYAVGIGTLAVAWGLRLSLAPGKRVLLSVVLTAVVGVGFLVAGTFTTDPTDATDTTTEGSLHLLGAVMVFPVIVACAFILLGVFRRDPIWSEFAGRVRWFPWLLFAGFIVSFFASPDDLLGITQRVYAAIVMAWIGTLAWQLRAVPRPHVRADN